MESVANVISPAERDLGIKLKAAKRANLVPGSKWNLIGTKWMRQWTIYIDLDGTRSNYLSNSPHPGPMNNSALLEEGTGKLKRNMLEDLDYSLVPAELYTVFVDIYGGGPAIVRNVVNCGTSRSIYNVDLYPMLYHVYVEDGKDSQIGSSVPAQPRVTVEQSKYSKFTDVKSSILAALDMQAEPPRRHNIWVRQPEHYNAYSARAERTSHPSQEDTSPRYLTTAVTDVLPGSWEHLDSDDIYTYNYPGGEIDILIEWLAGEESVAEDKADSLLTPEKAAVFKSLREAARARDGLLRYWQKDLRIGDVVDGCDLLGKWYEACVVPMPVGEPEPPTGSVRLHFKAWSAKFDDTVLPKDIPGRIWPLYSKTTNWRGGLRAGDVVELLTSEPGAVIHWETATVSSADHHKGFIKVRVMNNKIQDFKTIALQSDIICRHPTHVKDVSRAVTSTAVSSSGTGSSLSMAYRTLTGGMMHSGRSHETAPLQAGGAPGVVGLRNLGNTCFMNSMLQCLSHAKPLSDVFLSDRYMKQINTDNILGMGGKIANVYGTLLKDMWAQKYSVVNPYDFKDTIGQFQPQFAGYQQQDSQEFMLYLLDGLHEDMNRVLKKPFVEKIESKGRPDDMISREAWRRFLLRNDSEIVDRVFGQLKSHVTCRNCGHVSVTFDEFNSLALPVPVKNLRKITMTVFPLPVGEVPIILTLDVDFTSSIKDVKDAIVAALGPNVLSFPKSQMHNLTADMDFRNIDSEEYVIVGSDDQSPVSADNNVESRSLPDQPPPPPSINPYYFHVTSYSTYSKKVVWGLADDSPIQDIVKHATTQQLYIFQLEHDASLREYQEYDIVRGNSIQSSYSYKEKRPRSDEHGFRFVDVVMMKLSSPAQNFYYSHNKKAYPTSIGHAGRLSFEIGVTRYKDLYEAVEKLALSMLPADSEFVNFTRQDADKSTDSDEAPVAPFTVFYGTGQSKADEFPFDSEETVNTVLPGNNLVVLWTQDALKPSSIVSGAVEPISVATNLFRRRKFNSGILSDPFFADSEAIPGDCKSDEAGREQKATVSIQACLDKFIEREVMPEEETWYCPACKEHKSPIKKFDIWAAPEILIVQLKRFQYIPGSYFIHREKINDLVSFPIDGLDLTPYVRGNQGVSPPIYDLFAVSEHSGGLGGGHYTAVAKSPDSDSEWINYNDSYCSRASVQDIVTPAAYILFYKRRGPCLKWAGIEPLPLGILDQDKST